MKKKIINFFETILLVLSFLICIFVVGQKFIFHESGIFGYRMFVIVTSSMSPKLEIGDVILVKKEDLNKIKVKDLITYQGMEGDYKGKVVTHLVKNIKNENGQKIFYTKGLKNDIVDPAVKENQVYGKVIYKFLIISFFSKIIRSKIGYFLLILIPLIFILLSEVKNLKKSLKDSENNDIISEDSGVDQSLENMSLKDLKKLKKKI